MKFTSLQYAQALYSAVSEASPKDQDLVIDNFLKILAQNGDLGKYKEIEKHFHELDLKNKGIVPAEVTLAREVQLNAALLNELNEIAKGKLEVKTQIDENIVGGIVMRVGDTLLDASVKTQLENLKRTLES